MLSLGRVQLELADLVGDPQHLYQARAAFGRALSDARAMRSPRRVRFAAREVFEVATILAARPQQPEALLELARERLGACEAAMDATDELMRTGDLTDRVTEQEDSAWSYRGAVEELTGQGQAAPALIAAERGRARGFLAEIELLDTLPEVVQPDLAERERAARSRVRQARREQETSRSGELADASRDLGAIHAELARSAPELARLRSAAPPDIDELIVLAESLGPKAVVVSWYTTPAECFAFAVFGGTGEIRAERTGSTCRPSPASPSLLPTTSGSGLRAAARCCHQLGGRSPVP